MRSHDPPLWRWFVLPVAGVVALLIAGWLFVWFLGWSISRTDVNEDAAGAKQFAERFGLELADGDHVVYGETQSSFPDSGAYLVVDVPTIADRERLTQRSGARPCSPVSPTMRQSARPASRHGPGPSVSLVECSTPVNGSGGLIMRFDPVDMHLGTRIYIGAYEM